jgi:hypothetical protein
MPKDAVDKIVDRLRRAERGLEDYWNKVHRLRTIVGGDPRAIFTKGSSNDPSESDIKRAFTTERGDIFVKDIEEGRSNEILRTIRTLVQQTAHQFPEIEAEDLEFEESNLHAEYFRQRLGPAPIGCDAVVHMRRAIYDYLIGGFGWIWIGMQAGRPVIRYVDTLDCKWDQQASTVGDGRWWSTTMYGALSMWQGMFGPRKFDKFIKEKKPDADTPVELEYYYDIEGSEGMWKVLFKTGNDDVDHTPVYESKNPCFWDYAGQKVPYLPADCMFFMELPSFRLPISLAEQMLPSQMALWESEKTEREIVACSGFYEYEEGSYDGKALQNFENARTGSFLERKTGSAPLVQQKPMEIPQALRERIAYHKQNITGQGGADPYASGAPVEGTTYAAEVNAIKASASLMAGTISKETTALWLRLLRKYLAKGAAYDEWPMIVRHEEVDLVFDKSDPIKKYLKPDARFVLREESTHYEDKQTRLLTAKMRLETTLAVNAQTQGAYANAVTEDYNNFLQSAGERNLEKYKPVPVMAPAEAGPVATGQ